MSDNGTNYEIPENERPKTEQANPELSEVAKEFEEVVKKLGDALVMAWNSKERHQLESDLRKGIDRLVKEVDQGIKQAKESDAGQKVQAQAQTVAENVRTNKVTEDVRTSLAKALRNLSDALENAATNIPTEDAAKTDDAPKV